MVEMTAQYLSDALETAGATFDPGELAYLALTSKVELQLRDCLAWNLHTALPHIIVAREWKRPDLALLDETATALALIEAKALYTFDIATAKRANVLKYSDRVKKDLRKAHTLLTVTGQPAPRSLHLSWPRIRWMLRLCWIVSSNTAPRFRLSSTVQHTKKFSPGPGPPARRHSSP